MITYREGYKYQLVKPYTHLLKTAIRPAAFVNAGFLRLDTGGELYIIGGYAWDGPSGPAFDTPSFMRASLVHDALYQLMREGHLPLSWRDEADEEMRFVCLEAGMWSLRAAWCYQAVRSFGGPAASVPDPVLTAP
jgi:hypothetical protein